MGFKLDKDAVRKLSPNGIIWGEMIAEVLFADTRNRAHPLLQPYLPWGDRADNPYVNFDWDFCSPGKAALFELNLLT